MRWLSRRYWRYLTYLVVIVVLKCVIESVYSRRQGTKVELFSGDFKEEDLGGQIVVNVGKLDCFHAGTLWRYCYGTRETCTVDAAYTTRRIIRKDLKGSLGYRWFGTCQFLFYDVLPLSYVSKLDEQELRSFHMVTAVGESGGTKNVDNLHVSLEPLSLAAVSQDKPILSGINVLFGEDCIDPRPDWYLDKSWKLENGRIPSYLTYRYLKSPESADHLQRLTVREDGKFKIVQLADLHFATGKNECRDEYPKHAECDADSKTMHFIERVLDIESPDMVVYTGDQIMGDQSIQDSETSLMKALAPVIERKIPWALIWGNHDDEGSLTRWELSKIARTLPYSLFTIGPKDTADNSFGVGNYFHQVFDSEGKNALITLYFLDSHKYSTMGKIYPGYDWIKEAQWDYLRQSYDQKLKLTAAKDDSSHLSMAFFHIPLPEYLNIDSRKSPGTKNPFVGSLKEGVTAPKYNSGGIDTLNYLGVDVTSCGHDHCNDYCLLDDSTTRKIWLCFGGGAGEGGYGGYGGTERRIRTFQFDTKEGNIHTWKRLNGSPSETFDHQLVLEHGVPNAG
ncbi:hypothetical protein HG537_0E01210 [Torulaspora globosa]|uniref:Calcineurin-like phosphoesterase domain-containing protein n=1 Tax=Torulaspora globosa TaxID=48254 RepID=A0A7H9HUN5_9SACH|nr:hypothetical protein HG537_0E01210 [Torulaspora sp. CBS 2947]